MPASCRIPRQLIYSNVYVLKGSRPMVGAFGGPILREPHTVGPFIIDTVQRGGFSTNGNSPTPHQLSNKQSAILLSSSVGAQDGGGGGCGFPGTITFWKERQRGGLSGSSQPRGRGSQRQGKEEELLQYNRTGAGLSCRLWHHWQRQQHQPNPKEHETHLDLVNPEDGEGSTVLRLTPLEGQHPLASCFRQASPEEAAEDLEARGEPRYKYEGWGMGGDGGGHQQQLRIIAASLRIVYQEEDEDLGLNQNLKRGNSHLWGEEALLLRRGGNEESTAPLCMLSAESVSQEFAHLAPLVRSTLECVSVVPPHSLPLLPPPQQCMTIDNPKGSASLVSAFLLSAVGFFLLLISTFYVAYFL